MFWGGLILGERTSLIIMLQTLIAQSYVHLVLHPIIRPWRGAFGEAFLFMHDNVTPHTSRVDRNVLKMDVVGVLGRFLFSRPQSH